MWNENFEFHGVLKDLLKHKLEVNVRDHDIGGKNVGHSAAAAAENDLGSATFDLSDVQTADYEGESALSVQVKQPCSRPYPYTLYPNPDPNPNPDPDPDPSPNPNPDPSPNPNPNPNLDPNPNPHQGTITLKISWAPAKVLKKSEMFVKHKGDVVTSMGKYVKHEFTLWYAQNNGGSNPNPNRNPNRNPNPNQVRAEQWRLGGEPHCVEVVPHGLQR